MVSIPALGLDHVGIAADSPGTPLTASLGGLGASKRMPSGVEISRFGPDRSLELVWPYREGSPIAGFLAKRGPGPHHVALRVDVPLARLVAELREGGMRIAGAIEPAADGRPSVFLHPSSAGGVLVELVEGPPR